MEDQESLCDKEHQDIVDALAAWLYERHGNDSCFWGPFVAVILDLSSQPRSQTGFLLLYSPAPGTFACKTMGRDS